MKNVPFLNLSVTDIQEKKELMAAVDQVLTHGRIILGPEVKELEQAIASYCGRKYAVGVNSGTDALIFGLKSIGIGPGDEVITTSLSWVATANAIAILGATPVFADIGEDLNIDPASVKRLITARTKAIMPVHYTGRICDMESLHAIARDHSIPIVEDAAQAFGAQQNGKIAGSHGVVACFSMNPMKVFGALGEAGFVLTDDPKIYKRLTILRYSGTVNKEECIEVSMNGRLDTIQAAMLLVRLPRVAAILEKRRRIAAAYTQLLSGISGILRLPSDAPQEHSACYTYMIRVRDRTALMTYLTEKGIETKIQHPILMPYQPVHKNFPRDDIRRAERFVTEILCIPAHEKMDDGDVSYVAQTIRNYYDHTS